MNVPRPTWPEIRPRRAASVYARDRGDRNAEVVGHVTVRRKPRARAKAPLLDVLVDRVSDGGGRPAPAVLRDSAATLSWRNLGIDRPDNASERRLIVIHWPEVWLPSSRRHADPVRFPLKPPRSRSV